MNIGHSKYFSLVAIVAILVGFAQISAQEQQLKKYAYPSNHVKADYQMLSNDNLIPYKYDFDKTQEDEFVTIDSLSNMWSYLYIMTNRAFVYDKTTNNLITVKRGYYNPFKPEHSGYEGSNRSYNILMRISEDYGNNWNDEVVLYDKDDIGYYSARYPTCFGFKMDDKQYVTATFPVIDYVPGGTSSWLGFVSELWNQDITSSSEIPMNAHINLEHDNSTYDWSNDSRIVAGEKPDAPGEYFWVSASELTPENENDFANASHFGLRWTDDVENEFIETIPDAWNSDKFSVVDQAGSRFNQLIDLKMDDDGIMYLAAYGNFRSDNPDRDPNTVGVSISTDYGQTWDEFDLWTPDFRNAFLESLNNAGGTFAFNYTTKGFSVFTGGDFSIIVHGGLYDAGQTYLGSIIAEIYKENGEWGARKLSDFNGAYIVYRDIEDTDGNRVNPSDVELQLTSTIDGQYLVAKWIDLEDYDSEAGSFSTTDVYMSVRTKNETTWQEAINVTNSEEIDRNVMIPDYIENVTSSPKVPMLKLYSKTDETQSERDSQFVAGIDQLLKYDVADVIVSVEENTEIHELDMRVMPNPVTDLARIRVLYEGTPVQAEIAIYDIFGRKIAVIGNELLQYGATYFDYDASSLVSGAYYVTINVADRKITKQLNVIK